MRSAILAVSAIATLASAAAIDNEIVSMKRSIIKRNHLSTTTGASDAVVLNFALTLEHLESELSFQSTPSH